MRHWLACWRDAFMRAHDVLRTSPGITRTGWQRARCHTGSGSLTILMVAPTARKTTHSPPLASCRA